MKKIKLVLRQKVESIKLPCPFQSGVNIDRHKHWFGLPCLALEWVCMQLILQWSVGVLVLILCFLNRHKFSVEIVSKLGSSFSLVPFVIVVVSQLSPLSFVGLFFWGFHCLNFCLNLAVGKCLSCSNCFFILQVKPNISSS
jgi:hypothetical protein